jgi:phospholipase C
MSRRSRETSILEHSSRKSFLGVSSAALATASFAGMTANAQEKASRQGPEHDHSSRLLRAGENPAHMSSVCSASPPRRETIAMGRTAFVCFLLLLFSAAALILGLTSCAGYSRSSSLSKKASKIVPGKIEHVIIIFQENRTPDNLFHDPVLMANGADIASSGVNSRGQTVQLSPTSLGQNYDLDHSHGAFTAMCDLNTSTGTCKMDGADKVGVSCWQQATGCPPNPQFMYVQASDVQPYFDMAEQYTFADRMFQTNQGPSFPAHQFIISGTSEPSVNSPLFAAENPGGTSDPFGETGCTSPSAEYVQLIDPSGNEASNRPIHPCFEHATLTDELNSAGITWRYYAPSPGIIWNAPNAIQHMCGRPGSTSCTAPDWVNNVSLMTPQNPAPVLTDIAAGQLQQVSWVIPGGANCDHPGSAGVTGGPSWAAAIVNAIGNSPYWSNTAIIITWDDWGGWYDHVPPKLVNDGSSWGSGYVYGFRVPLIVVSPYAKPAYISHVNHDFGSILNFTEQVFGLPSLGYADARADDLSDCFNFSQHPLQFKTIAAPLTAQHFLDDRITPMAPDDD